MFVELTSYIEKAVYSGTLLFKLSEIHVLYVNRLEDLGIKKAINKTRLKVRLLEHFPEALEQFDGRNTTTRPSGCFPPECQEFPQASSLSFPSGPNLKDQDKRESQTCLTIGQLVLYNIKKRPPDSTVKTRHTLAREPPLSIYIGPK